MDNRIGGEQPRVFQPLPRHEPARPLADFQARMRQQGPAARPVGEAAAPVPARETAPPLPAAPLFNRQVAREAPRTRIAEPARPPARDEAPAAPAAEGGRGAVPVRLVQLLQQAQGREAVGAMARRAAAQAVQAVPLEQVARDNPVRVMAQPAERVAPREPVVRLATLERPAAAPAQARSTRTAVIAQEIQQLNARQNFQEAVRTRTNQEEGGAGARRTARALLDLRV